MSYKNTIDDFKNNKIGIFELALLFDKGVDVKNKEEGVIYTPKYIADYIISLADPDIDDIILEPSVGHGVFLFSLINFMEEKYKLTKKDLKYWFENNVIANDVNTKTIEELKLILTAFFDKKGIKNISAKNIFVADSLFHDYQNIDIVVGNPPYIRTKNINEDYLKKIRDNFKTCRTGNIDIYYAFIEKFSKKVKRLSFITPNSYMTNVSAKKLRTLIQKNLVSVVDFKDKLIFENARTYTSIFLLDNTIDSDCVQYSNTLNEKPVPVKKSKLKTDKWAFKENLAKSIIPKDDFNKLSFTSGIETLRNNIFTIKNAELSNGFYTQTYNGEDYLIEKDLCVPFYKLTKPNDKSVIIHPYKNGSIMTEAEIARLYPMGHKYLLDVKPLLNQRDKGKTDKYEAWFAYGRKQGLNIKNNSHYLLIPIMTNKPLNLEVKTIKSPFLIGSGYCIESSDYDLLNKIKDELSTKAFFEYLELVGRAWQGKTPYYTVTSKQLKSFINNE